jgi:hypothetical protein
MTLKEHINKIALEKFPVVPIPAIDYWKSERNIFIAGATLILEMNLPVLFAEWLKEERYEPTEDKRGWVKIGGSISKQTSTLFKYWVEKIYKP